MKEFAGKYTRKPFLQAGGGGQVLEFPKFPRFPRFVAPHAPQAREGEEI